MYPYAKIESYMAGHPKDTPILWQKQPKNYRDGQNHEYIANFQLCKNSRKKLAGLEQRQKENRFPLSITTSRSRSLRKRNLSRRLHKLFCADDICVKSCVTPGTHCEQKNADVGISQSSLLESPPRDDAIFSSAGNKAVLKKRYLVSIARFRPGKMVCERRGPLSPKIVRKKKSPFFAFFFFLRDSRCVPS